MSHHPLSTDAIRLHESHVSYARRSPNTSSKGQANLPFPAPPKLLTRDEHARSVSRQLEPSVARVPQGDGHVAGRRGPSLPSRARQLPSLLRQYASPCLGWTSEKREDIISTVVQFFLCSNDEVFPPLPYPLTS